MAYIGSSPTKVVSRQSANIFTYTATANQTAFTGADANGNTLACSPSDIMVHMNGIKLEESDYTATTTTVTLGSGAAVGDEVTITAFLTFESADHYTKSAADTRYVNTSGDTMTGTLVAGTRLQVGDSSITNAYSGNPAFGYVADFQGSSGTQTFISIAAPTASSLGDNGVIIGEDATDTYLLQRGNKNIKLATQDLTRINIDGSGRVTMPYQPAFGVYKTASTTSGGTVTHNGSWANVGSHYNSSNGRFTCPVSGTYYFYCTGLTQPSGNVSRMSIFVNGSTQASQSRNENLSGDYLHIVTLGVMTLSANDYVTMYYANDDGSTTLYSDTSPYITFGGYLIG